MHWYCGILCRLRKRIYGYGQLEWCLFVRILGFWVWGWTFASRGRCWGRPPYIWRLRWDCIFCRNPKKLILHSLQSLGRKPGTAPYTTTLDPPLFRSVCSTGQIRTTIVNRPTWKWALLTEITKRAHIRIQKMGLQVSECKDGDHFFATKPPPPHPPKKWWNKHLFYEMLLPRLEE